MVDASQLLNIDEIEVTGLTFEEDWAIFHAKSRRNRIVCPHCESKVATVSQTKERKVRDLPYGNRKALILLKVKQFHCWKCKKYVNEPFDFVERGRNLSRRFKDKIGEDLRHGSVTEVAEKNEVSWDTTNRIKKNWLRNEWVIQTFSGK